VEAVVERQDEYDVVRKNGPAADTARRSIRATISPPNEARKSRSGRA